MNAIPPLETLSCDQKIGQVLCFGWQGAAPRESRAVNRHARILLDKFQVGSVVFLGRNVGVPDETRELVDALQRSSKIPLLVAVDQEGGTVNRLGTPLHQFPGNMALGAIRDGAEELARKQAEAQARELRALGFNWNFAPCVDVNNNPDNPIIGVRSFGEIPERVAALGRAAIRGLQGAGVLACAKHFPGHGDTSVDSHLALPVMPGGCARLNLVELPPFQAAIEEGVGSIMTAHIRFAGLDSSLPATLSPAILTGLLRVELGFDGLVITDCLEMDAIAARYGTAPGAVQALQAGADVVLICHTLGRQHDAVAAIHAAVKSGELPESRLDEAAGRVLAAKRRFLAGNEFRESEPWTDPRIDALESEIARRSITMVVHTDGFVNKPQRHHKLLLISMHPAIDSFALAVRAHHSNLRVVRYGDEFEALTMNELAGETGEGFDAAIILTCPNEPWSDSPIDQHKQAILVRMLHSWFQERLMVVSIREPYDIRRFPKVQNYVCSYSYRPSSLRALAAAIFGEFKPPGRLPVTIPGIRQWSVS